MSNGEQNVHRCIAVYSFTIICLRSSFWSGSFAGSNCGMVLLEKRNMTSGCSIFPLPRTVAASQSLNTSGADNDSSPRHHIFICGIGGCFFCSLSGAIRFAVAERSRRLCRRFSRGCATTNAIVLMTLPTAPQRSVSTAATGYIISTGALRGAGVPPAPPKNKATKHLSFSLYNKQVIINKCKAADLYYEIGCLAIL